MGLYIIHSDLSVVMYLDAGVRTRSSPSPSARTRRASFWPSMQGFIFSAWPAGGSGRPCSSPRGSRTLCWRASGPAALSSAVSWPRAASGEIFTSGPWTQVVLKHSFGKRKNKTTQNFPTTFAKNDERTCFFQYQTNAVVGKLLLKSSWVTLLQLLVKVTRYF